MLLSNIPLELFEIASAFLNTQFQPKDIWYLDSSEWQLWVPLKDDDSVGIYLRFYFDKPTVYRFHESYSSLCETEFTNWINRDDAISKFNLWYQHFLDDEDT